HVQPDQVYGPAEATRDPNFPVRLYRQQSGWPVWAVAGQCHRSWNKILVHAAIGTQAGEAKTRHAIVRSEPAREPHRTVTLQHARPRYGGDSGCTRSEG